MTTAKDSTNLRRVAKGKKPRYFKDPATDRLFSMVVTLTQELSVAKERIDTLEDLLSEKAIASASEIEFYEPSADRLAQREKDRTAFVQRVFRSSKTDDPEPTAQELKVEEVLS